MGITTGTVPAAAISGMLLGFGMRSGSPGRAFEAFGVGALAGVLLVNVLMLLCGVVYVAVVAQKRQLRMAWTIAITVAAIAVMLVCERLAGGDVARVLSTPNLIELGVVLAIALPIGMRLALSQV